MQKPSDLYLIGLTGNIACGKSTVVNMVAALGAQTIDADKVTHQVQEPGTHIYNAIIETFGTHIVTHPNGPIDRRALGNIVFRDPQALQRLEAIVHPAVHAEIQAWLQRAVAHHATHTSSNPNPLAGPVALIDAVKLLEAGWKAYCDAVWVVTCTEAQQIERLIHTRGMREDEARQRIAAQPPQASRIAHADVVIDNSKTLDNTRRQVETAWQQIVNRSLRK